MSYQVIARKWRPQIFEEVIGQEAVTKTLRNAIEYDRLHHAYIFSGARGVGKTTTARILAKALNCHKKDKANPTPCNTSADDSCPSCIEIAESRSIDVFEFDAASHTGVDDIREIILEGINIGAARDRYKVFIIDEVHMLSKSSFNALLKTLEEPPENVVFVMATTELHKVPDTILSRVQEFEFRTIPKQKLLDRLKTIADAEKVDISDDGLKEIARSGEGSMRDAQSNFDQVISFSSEKISTEDVINALGIASAENLTSTVQAISEKDAKVILKVVDDLVARGQDLRHFCTDLLTLVRDMLVYKTAGDGENLLDTAILSVDELKKYSEPFTDSDLIRFFNTLAVTDDSLHEANEPRYLLEIGLIKLIEMRKVQPIEQLLERLGKLESVLNITEIDSDENAKAAPADQTTTQEKKTLKPDFHEDEVPFPTESEVLKDKGEETQITSENKTPDLEKDQFVETPFEQPEDDLISDPPMEFSDKQEDFESARKVESQSNIDIDAMPVKLEPIDSEDLEHVDDKWLDKIYEYKLRHEGDDIRSIPNASKIVQVLLNKNSDTPISAEIETTPQTNGSAASPARSKQNKALDIVSEMTTYEEIDENIPELPNNPTDEELFIYAKKHPSVKKIMRIFRGKLIKVEKKEKK